MGSMYGQIFGGLDVESPPPPNRAQRRAQAKRDRAAQRKGQRAYERTLAQREDDAVRLSEHVAASKKERE